MRHLLSARDFSYRRIQANFRCLYCWDIKPSQVAFLNALASRSRKEGLSDEDVHLPVCLSSRLSVATRANRIISIRLRNLTVFTRATLC